MSTPSSNLLPPPVRPSDASLLYLHSLSESIDDHSASISALLLQLVDNSKQRIAGLRSLERTRDTRDTLLQLEFAAQERSRELLHTARREMDLQERWSGEIRATYERAESEGLAIDEEPQTTAGRIERELTAAGGDADKSRKGLTVMELVGAADEEARREIYRRQILYLTNSHALSVTRLRSILSRSLSSSSTSSPSALAHLHTLSLTTSRRLASLSIERAEVSAELGKREMERARDEGRVEDWVLEECLRWDERRRDRWREEETRKALESLALAHVTA